jgi:mRNA-degrading endonuclease RelE of RelBE toxin-antitoxin system
MIFSELPAFTHQAEEHLPDDELLRLQLHLMDRPDAGDVIPSGRGLRKIRWRGSGRGKRGGLRIIYYWVTEDHVIILARCFPKNEQENLSPNELKDILRQIKP